VIDADAINIIGADRSILEEIPKNSIFTPHLKEFDRLVGPSANSIQRIEKLKTFATRYNQVVVLKGAHTTISFPNGLVLFNSTGNPGMATAGSGDVLAGVIAGMLSQGLKSAQAAILGVYFHGLAGDFAKKELGVIGINATDIIKNIPKAINSF
jgi:NAD(P)H-hydrate epimerase